METTDRTDLPQPADPGEAGGRGDADPVGEGVVRHPAVDPQKAQQLQVDVIETSNILRYVGHSTLPPGSKCATTVTNRIFFVRLAGVLHIVSL
nr:hypothetical protein Ade03nite_92490 [Actinoplanes derwentensis]